MAVLIVSCCLAAALGVYQEWPGPWWRVASMGDGLSEGRKPFRGKGEVFPLPEGSIRPQPAQLGSLTAARDCPAPGNHCATRSDHGRKALSLRRCYLTCITAPVVGMLLSKASIIAHAIMAEFMFLCVLLSLSNYRNLSCTSSTLYTR